MLSAVFITTIILITITCTRLFILYFIAITVQILLIIMYFYVFVLTILVTYLISTANEYTFWDNNVLLYCIARGDFKQINDCSTVVAETSQWLNSMHGQTWCSEFHKR